MAGMKARSLKGVRWGAIENVGVRAITLATFLALARLLDKEAFGVVALGLAYVAFIELVVRIGLTEVIIQKNNLTDLHLDTAFWLSVALGLFALGTTIAVAPLIAMLSDADDLESVVRWLALGILPLSLTRVQEGLLTRNMRFKGLALRRLAGTISGSIVGVGFALSGFGAWSLVAQQLVTRTVDFVALYWTARWYPRLRFSPECLSEMFSYSSKIMGINGVNFTSRQVDRFVIGHFLGAGPLGIYVVGRKLVEVILSIFTGVIGKVALASFSRLQAEEQRLARAATSVSQLTAAIGVPVLSFIALKGSELTVALFGDKWMEAGPVVQIAALTGIARICSLFVIPLYKARGMPGRVLVATGIQALVSIVLCIMLAPLGLEAMAAGWMAGEVIGALILLAGVSKTGVAEFKSIIRSYVVPLVCAGIACVVVYQTNVILLPEAKITWTALLTDSAFFAAAYLLGFRLLSPEIFKKSLENIKRVMRDAPAGKGST